MGCDIHLAVERRTAGRWQRVLPPAEARDPWLVKQAEKQPGSYYKQYSRVVWYDDRNYDCFAILANVRNGFGFAGCDTGNGFIPISEPRGLPNDMSDAVRALAEDSYDENDISLGDHSFSWLTVAELDAYDWTRTTTKRGVISLEQFTEREASGIKTAPSNYCGGISGKGIFTLTEDAARKQLYGGGLAVAAAESCHVQTGWTVTYAQAAGRFYSELLPHLRKLGNPADVRIIFGFDS